MAGLTIELDRCRVILDRATGKVPDHYSNLSMDQFQAQVLVDLGYHELLGKGEETYKSELPKITKQPKVLPALYTPLIIDPRININEVFRRAYIEYTDYISPDKFVNLEPEPGNPYIAWFNPGDIMKRSQRHRGTLIFNEFERPSRIREAATFTLIAPLLGLGQPHLVSSGSIFEINIGVFAAIRNIPGQIGTAKLDFDSTSYGISSCAKDSELELMAA